MRRENSRTASSWAPCGAERLQAPVQALVLAAEALVRAGEWADLLLVGRPQRR